MFAFSTAFFMVLLAEMGDKTQLLAMAFATKYPWKKVLLGILAATILNHLLAILAGVYLNSLIPRDIVEIVTSLAFIVFGLLLLTKDKLGNEANTKRINVFWTVTIAFFLAEMGDKTQLATLALSAQFGHGIMDILMGSTLGMLIADGLGILLGSILYKYCPDCWIKRFAATVFIIFGFIGILNYFSIISVF